MKTEPNDAAFARAHLQSDTHYTAGAQDGLTKRECFASMAMQGMLAGDLGIYTPEDAVRQADALIEALNK